MVRAVRCIVLSNQRLVLPLRAVLLAFVVSLAGAAWAGPGAGAETDAPQARIEQASQALEQIRRSWGDADAPETLKTLSERAVQVQRDAEAGVQALQPDLAQLDARIEQLGPAPESGEEPDIARQR